MFSQKIATGIVGRIELAVLAEEPKQSRSARPEPVAGSGKTVGVGDVQTFVFWVVKNGETLHSYPDWVLREYGLRENGCSASV